MVSMVVDQVVRRTRVGGVGRVGTGRARPNWDIGADKVVGKNQLETRGRKLVHGPNLVS